jgi:hypothetical protein
MAFTILQLTTPNWTYDSNAGLAKLFFDPVVLAEGSFMGTLYGFDESTTYYAVKIQMPAYYSAGGGSAGTDANSTLGPTVSDPAWLAGEGQVTRELVFSLPSPLTGAQINNQTFSCRVVASYESGAASGRVFGLVSSTTGEPRLNVIGSTNPADGGQTPPDPIKLSVSPSGTVVVLQNTQQLLNASCVSDGGVYYSPQTFSLAVVTPGLGTFAANGGTSLNQGNSGSGMIQTAFNIAPGFTGLGQISCNNSYASNAPQYWTFDVKAPVVASGAGFLGLMQFPAG